jgi:hypothetical protein
MSQHAATYLAVCGQESERERESERNSEGEEAYGGAAGEERARRGEERREQGEAARMLLSPHLPASNLSKVPHVQPAPINTCISSFSPHALLVKGLKL